GARLAWLMDRLEPRDPSGVVCTGSVLRVECACGGRAFYRLDTDMPQRCGLCRCELAPSRLRPEYLSAGPDAISPTGSLTAAPVRCGVFVADIVCLLCGRHAGTATAQRWPPNGPILFQPPDAQTATLIRAWWRVRCAVCGGNTAADEVTT